MKTPDNTAPKAKTANASFAMSDVLQVDFPTAK